MQVICPTCNTSYNIAEGKIPSGKKVTTTCKRCGGKMVIELTPSTRNEETVKPDTLSRPEINSERKRSPTPSTETTEAVFLAVFADYPELQELELAKFDLEQIFKPNRKGGYKSRKNKRKVKVLKGIYPPLTKMLKEEERVTRLGFGVAYYPAELFFGNGYLTMLYNYYAILCTNQRLLFINVNSKMIRPTHYFSQLLYSDIKRVRRGLFGFRIILEKTKGKRRIFNMKPHLSKDLKQFVEEKKESMAGMDMEKSGEILENLCPSCFVPLEKGLIRCSQCGADFKEPKKALIRSLLLPGLGDIYLGHRALGILELIGSFFAWILVLSFLLSGKKENMIIAAIILLLYNGVDGLLTYHMAKKGYMLAKRQK